MHVPLTEIILRHEGADLAHVTLPPGEYVIGRSPEAEVFADTPLLSQQHARLTLNYDQILLEDLESSGGTFVADRPLTEATRVFPNQAVRLGAVTVEIRRQRPVAEMGGTLLPSEATLQRFLPVELLGSKRYALGPQIAQGGMGAILDAREVPMKRQVAMKVMLDSADEADVLRFIEEAQVTGQLDHPNIVPIHELGVNEHGQPFYTMKMVHGITLKKVLDLLAQGVEATLRKYSLPTLLTLFQKACDAVAFAHSKGVMHRDLKPENIMLGDFGSVLVMDWGLAKVQGQKANVLPDRESRTFVGSARRESGALGSTMAGTILGTPQYMSPEQARGEVETMDERADVYALGAILYHILALRPSVMGEDAMEIVEKVARGEVDRLENLTPRRQVAKGGPSGAPPSPATSRPGVSHLPGGRIPDSLAAVCRKAMALEPAARYPNVPALQAEIEAFQDGFATRAEKAGAWRQFTLLVRRKKAASIGVAAVLLVGGTFGAKALVEGRRAERTLGELRGTAPEFAARAAELFANGSFAEADRKLDYAIVLDPKHIGYRLTKADFYEDQLRFPDAAKVLHEILALDPKQRRAGEHAALCEQLERTRDADGKLPRAVLAELLERMTKEGRSPAEKFAVARQLGQENEAVREVWLEKLKGLPTGNRSLKGRLVLTAEGGMGLNLADTTLNDLAPLRGMPLHKLDISRTLVTDLGPLQGMQLKIFTAAGCHLTDVSALAGMPLTDLDLSHNQITSLAPLVGLPLEYLKLAESPVEDLSPLRGMPLTYLEIIGSRTPDLEALRGMALTILNLTNANSISDLSPLAGMPLNTLQMYGNDRISDLEPLRAAPLEKVFIGDCQRISSIAPLAQPRLLRLSLRGCGAVVDLRPLAVCMELEELVLPPNAREIEFLRALPKLKKLSYKADLAGGQWTRKTAEEFWKEFDARK